MHARFLLRDLAIGLAAGYVATKATEHAQDWLDRLTPEDVEATEDAIREAPSARLAAEDVGEELGLDTDDERTVKRLQKDLHLGLGIGWGATYVILRRWFRMPPLAAGLTSGAAMSLVVDEAIVPAAGWSPSNRAFPWFTHLRGLLAHLIYGAALAAAAEILAAASGVLRRRRSHDDAASGGP